MPRSSVGCEIAVTLAESPLSVGLDDPVKIHNIVTKRHVNRIFLGLTAIIMVQFPVLV
jgi:hypothetical protein